jgi:hypothetical protein
MHLHGDFAEIYLGGNLRVHRASYDEPHNVPVLSHGFERTNAKSGLVSGYKAAAVKRLACTELARRAGHGISTVPSSAIIDDAGACLRHIYGYSTK